MKLSGEDGWLGGDGWRVRKSRGCVTGDAVKIGRAIYGCGGRGG